jgi:hypothetical protein
MEKWKEQFLESIETMPNEQLLDDYSQLCGGDDYDGCFTSRGEWELEQLNKELRKRLKECKFL